ncbi:MAG: hypothetical protein Q8R24_08955 [Legionellaceae bacterium]|nr:hypothetical protein [Legionellaceae bacterium]
MLRATFAAILAFLLFLMLHVLDFYFLIPQERTHSLLITALIGLVCFLLMCCYFPNEEWFQRKLRLNDNVMHRFIFPLLGAFFYGFLFLGYTEFYFTAERSITFRMLMLISKQPDQTITQETMFAQYDVSGIITKRLDDLAYGGFLIHQSDSYKLTSKGKMTLSIYQIALDCLRFDNGEKK